MDWKREVVELHEAFEAWFRGSGGDELMARMQDAFAPALTYVGPDGSRVRRARLLEALNDMRGAMPDVTIRVSDFEELHRPDGWVVGAYRETHRKGGEIAVRSTTAIFRMEEDAPCGVRWLHVHETWLG